MSHSISKLSLAFLFLFFHASHVLAVPHVTAIPISSTETCAAWPGWLQNADRVDVTEPPLILSVSHSDDPGIEGLYTSQGTEAWSPGPPGSWSPSSFSTVTIDLRKSKMFARATFRCFNGQFEYYGGNYSAIYVNPDARNGRMMFDVKGADPKMGHKLQAYRHEIDGVRQEGVYLGALGNTTWGFVYQRPDAKDCAADGDKVPLDYYDATLQGLPDMDYVEPRASYNPARYVYGFLRIDVWN
jgi:hypothetical protein